MNIIIHAPTGNPSFQTIPYRNKLLNEVKQILIRTRDHKISWEGFFQHQELHVEVGGVNSVELTERIANKAQDLGWVVKRGGYI
jgi:hypothetical protein